MTLPMPAVGPSKPWQQFFKDALSQPGDEQVGAYPRDQLMQMDAPFCDAVDRAIASGEEQRAAPPGNRERLQSAAAPYEPD
jgi:hypothetical protein